MKEGQNVPCGLFSTQVLLRSTTLGALDNYELDIGVPLGFERFENADRSIAGAPVTDYHLEDLRRILTPNEPNHYSDVYLFELAK